MRLLSRFEDDEPFRKRFGKIALYVIGAIAVLVFVWNFIGSARAADKGGPTTGVKAIDDVVSSKGWTGLYIGADAGINVLDAIARRSRETVKTADPVEGSDPPDFTYTFNPADSILNADGLGGKDWTYGVRGGFDFQPSGSPFVIGILGGYGWGSVGGSFDYAIADFAGIDNVKGASFSIEPTWHVGGRVGLVLMSKTLVYVGGAWAQAEASGAVTVSGSLTAPTKLASTQTVDGYMILAGLETIIAPQWTLGAEYSYARYDTVNFVGDVMPAPGTTDGARHNLSVEPDVHAFKVRLNWRPFSQ